MRVRAPAIFAVLALLILFPATGKCDAISNLEVIQLHPGINEIAHLVPDDRQGVIIKSWRANANAQGYNVYIVMLDNKLVGLSMGDKFEDEIMDEPHAVSDAVRSVRFATGMMDGEKTVFLITATRNLSARQAPEDAAQVIFDVYHIASNGGVGTTGDYFSPVSETTSKEKYCNSDLAMSKNFGFPLPTPYEGPNQIDGCY